MTRLDLIFRCFFVLIYLAIVSTSFGFSLKVNLFHPLQSILFINEIRLICCNSVKCKCNSLFIPFVIFINSSIPFIIRLLIELFVSMVFLASAKNSGFISVLLVLEIFPRPLILEICALCLSQEIPRLCDNA